MQFVKMFEYPFVCYIYPSVYTHNNAPVKKSILMKFGTHSP